MTDRKCTYNFEKNAFQWLELNLILRISLHHLLDPDIMISDIMISDIKISDIGISDIEILDIEILDIEILDIEILDIEESRISSYQDI